VVDEAVVDEVLVEDGLFSAKAGDRVIVTQDFEATETWHIK